VKIDELSEEEAQDLLKQVCSMLGIHDFRPAKPDLLEQLNRTIKRRNCLGWVESVLYDSAPELRSNVDWDMEPAKYSEKFKALLDRILSVQKEQKDAPPESSTVCLQLPIPTDCQPDIELMALWTEAYEIYAERLSPERIRDAAIWFDSFIDNALDHPSGGD